MKQKIFSQDYDRGQDMETPSIVQEEIDAMWLDKEKTKYDVGWNSALAELQARLIIKQRNGNT
jgi:hypothetical protein